jgi:hypothetical protein
MVDPLLPQDAYIAINSSLGGGFKIQGDIALSDQSLWNIADVIAADLDGIVAGVHRHVLVNDVPRPE